MYDTNNKKPNNQLHIKFITHIFLGDNYAIEMLVMKQKIIVMFHVNYLFILLQINSEI